MHREEILKREAHRRTRCVVYTRVMGYHRPVESFNIGKKGEHRQRKPFVER
ncbi:anaerobic ribonucleoside-triphosphate reductase [Hydrogenimonas sp.]